MCEEIWKRSRGHIVSSVFLHVMLAQLMSFISQIIANLVDSVSISRFLSPEHLSAFSFSSTLTSVVMMAFLIMMTVTKLKSGGRFSWTTLLFLSDIDKDSRETSAVLLSLAELMA